MSDADFAFELRRNFRPVSQTRRTREFGDGIIVRGDHRDTVSNNAALISDRRAAELAIRRPIRQ